MKIRYSLQWAARLFLLCLPFVLSFRAIPRPTLPPEVIVPSKVIYSGKIDISRSARHKHNHFTIAICTLQAGFHIRRVSALGACAYMYIYIYTYWVSFTGDVFRTIFPFSVCGNKKMSAGSFTGLPIIPDHNLANINFLVTRLTFLTPPFCC